MLFKQIEKSQIMKKISFNTLLNIMLVGVAVLFIGRYFYFKPKFIKGEPVPNFEATIMNGETMQLSDLRGKFVLVDFWGSWCGPCRMQNPHLVQLYDKYNQAKFKNADGFEIVSIGVERDERRWKNAIAKDNLKWKYHILDLTSSMKFFNSDLAKIFGVKELPSTYLLNEKGVIMGVNVPPGELDQILDKKRN